MSDIIGCLELVASEALALGIDLSKNLRPPATLSQIATDSEGLPFQLTKEVADLYVWHDGVWPEGQTSEYCVFPMFFLSTSKECNFSGKRAIARAE